MRLNSKLFVMNNVNPLNVNNSKYDKDFTMHPARNGFQIGVTYLLANVFNTSEIREIAAKIHDSIENSIYKNHISSASVLTAFDTGVLCLPRPNIAVNVYFKDSILSCSTLALHDIEQKIRFVMNLYKYKDNNTVNPTIEDWLSDNKLVVGILERKYSTIYQYKGLRTTSYQEHKALIDIMSAIDEAYGICYNKQFVLDLLDMVSYILSIHGTEVLSEFVNRMIIAVEKAPVFRYIEVPMPTVVKDYDNLLQIKVTNKNKKIKDGLYLLSTIKDVSIKYIFGKRIVDINYVDSTGSIKDVKMLLENNGLYFSLMGAHRNIGYVTLLLDKMFPSFPLKEGKLILGGYNHKMCNIEDTPLMIKTIVNEIILTARQANVRLESIDIKGIQNNK